jgi:hypothetical protein
MANVDLILPLVRLQPDHQIRFWPFPTLCLICEGTTVDIGTCDILVGALRLVKLRLLPGARTFSGIMDAFNRCAYLSQERVELSRLQRVRHHHPNFEGLGF